MPMLLFLVLLACPDTSLSVQNTAPEATISSPGDQAELMEGASITLLGEANDRESSRDGQPLTITWYADDTEICPGSVADADDIVTCAWTATEGTSQLRLLVADAAHATAEDQIAVTVTANYPPAITVVAPTVDGEYYFDTQVNLEALVSDPESAPEDLVVSWVSSLQGELAADVAAASSGTSATTASLSEGEHLLTATVTDPAGNTDIATVQLTVHSANTAPDCDIQSPLSGSAFALGDVVTFTGAIADLETAPTRLTLGLDSQYEAISADVPVDDEGSFTYPWVPTVAGTHVVTLTGEDSLHEQCVDIVTLEVCDAVWYFDGDADGAGDTNLPMIACEQPANYAGVGGDCNDASSAVKPGAAEEESLSDCMQDSDGDGWGDASVPSGVTPGSDCDDGDATVNPSATEVCDTLDNDCDGTVDGATAADSSLWYADVDNDSYGDPSAPVAECDAPAGYVANRTDCDDGDSGDHPGATEDCDGKDNDCDGDVDEDGTSTFYADADSDGYGDASATSEGCSAPAGYVVDNTDCDDADVDVHPGATETCDEDDEDCNGVVDDGASLVWYADADADTYGDGTDSIEQCSAPTGYVANSRDCHDGDADSFPGAAEEESPSDCMQDRDGDGWGDDAPPSGVAAGTDCDDGDGAINPDGAELCDSEDNDCDTVIDEGVTITVYADDDGDGFGEAASPASACSAGADQADNDDDCDDTEVSVNPDANEVCDAIDNDCDGDVDDDDPGLDTSTGDTFYADNDSDGYGDATSSIGACELPSGYLADDSDCDDSDSRVYPWAGDDYGDGVDGDCDGLDCEASLLTSTDDYYAVCGCTNCNWTTASSYCDGAGYDGLTSIPSAAADDKLLNLALVVDSSGYNMWIGLRSPWTTWSDGTTVSYTNWVPGDPAGRGSFGDKSLSAGYGYKWADFPDNGMFTLSYACSISGI